MKRIFFLALLTVGILLSIGALSQLYLNRGVSSSTALDLPSQLAGLSLTESKTGNQAIAEFMELHGKSFPITLGAVGIYGNRDITLWVASTASDSVALELTNTMQERIGEGRSPFTPVDEINDRNRKVYALEGMGQKYYYFQSQNLVIWLAAEPALAGEALQQILEVY